MKKLSPGQRRIKGLYTGGTLASEAKFILQAYQPVIIDLDDDEYTRGSVHPMIDPSRRTEHVISAFSEPDTAILLCDVAIGFGSHSDPAGGCGNLGAPIQSICSGDIRGDCQKDAKGGWRRWAITYWNKNPGQSTQDGGQREALQLRRLWGRHPGDASLHQGHCRSRDEGGYPIRGGIDLKSITAKALHME